MLKKNSKSNTEKRWKKAISSILAQGETVCENNLQCKNTEQKKLKETMWLLTKEISNKNKKLSDNEKTIDRMAKREKEMEKRDSEKSKEMEKIKHKLEVSKKQGSTPMNSVGTKGQGMVTKISELTGQTLTGFTTTELTSFCTRVEREQMKELVAAVKSIVNVYCRKECFPINKFLTDDMAAMALKIGYAKR